MNKEELINEIKGLVGRCAEIDLLREELTSAALAEGASAQLAEWAVGRVMRSCWSEIEANHGLAQSTAEARPDRDERFERVRDYVIGTDKPITPISAVAVACNVTKSDVSRAFALLQTDGVVKKRRKPGSPAYVQQWVRT